MYSKELVSAVAALGLVSGVAALGCKDNPVQINSQADADQAAECTSIANDVIISNGAGPNIDLSGSLATIKGDLVVKNNSLIQTLRSDSLKSVGGTFQLNNVISLYSLVFPVLGEVGSIEWVTLSALQEPTFGNPGITKAKSVLVADTFVSNLDGINVQDLVDMNINNNKRLSKFSTSIKTLSNTLHVNSNAINMEMEMPNLEWIANMTIANVSSFSIPSLKAVNGSMFFDSNYFTEFSAPNLTAIQSGSLSFVSNPELTNITIPKLTKVGGGVTVANNTALAKLNSLGSLKDVGGAILVRGSLTEIDLPSLDNVVGTAFFTSTDDISSSCDALNKLSGNVIQGTVTTCKSNDTMANNSTDSSDSGSGSNSGSGSGSDTKGNGASIASSSVATVVTLAALAGMVATFL